MGLYNYLNRINRLDMLIRNKRTGPPKELADKLNISERWLYTFLDELKTELDCPIRYDRKRRSYVYDEPGKVMIGFASEMSRPQLRKVSGGWKFANLLSDGLARPGFLEDQGQRDFKNQRSSSSNNKLTSGLCLEIHSSGSFSSSFPWYA